MILYNVTIKIDFDIEAEWLDWMTTTHIPAIMDTGYFIGHRICKLLSPKDDEGQNYSIQYLCGSLKDLQLYHGLHAPQLQAEHLERFKDKFVDFHTVMEILE